jgi:hypothetical protein
MTPATNNDGDPPRKRSELPAEPTLEPSEERLLSRARQQRDQRIVDHAAQLLATLCHPLRRRQASGGEHGHETPAPI